MKKQLKGMDLMIFCTKYLDYSKRFTVKTYKEKKRLCRQIIEEWGANYPVLNIDSEMILTYLDKQAEIRSNNAFNKDRKNLLAMWNWGMQILELPSNPVLKIRRRAHDRKPQYTPSQEDVLKVLAVADRQERIFLDCYLQTGARRSEIYRWIWIDDINLERREVRLGTRKTKDGSMEYEWIPMSDDLYESLIWWWKNRPIKNSPYVFVCMQPGANYGKPFKVRRRFMGGLCKRAGVTPFGFHALRRYVASILADTHKVSAKTIQRILRHKNVTTTERYIHNINRDLQETMNLLSKTNLPDDLPQIKKEVKPNRV
ncbi:MAG: tyrosine-type recombinase/integrase [Deltaproteobacteria bacterium]|nr:tyrosine-type recombinase/integrase [Deltaproteobacteria bacterium]